MHIRRCIPFLIGSSALSLIAAAWPDRPPVTKDAVGKAEATPRAMLGSDGAPTHGFFPQPQYDAGEGFVPDWARYSWSVAIGDYDRDGWPDLASTCSLSGNSSGFGVFFNNNGDRTFSVPASYYLPSESGNVVVPVSIVTADLDGDDWLDLAIAGRRLGAAHRDAVLVYLNDGTGGFRMAGRFFVTGVDINGGTNIGNGLVAADFDADGRIDLAVVVRCTSTTQTNPCPVGGHVSVLLNRPDPGDPALPTFPEDRIYPIGDRPDAITAGYLDDDEWPDLAVVFRASSSNATGRLAVLLNWPDPDDPSRRTFVTTPGSPYDPGISPNSASIADVNMDGWPDILVSNGNTSAANSTVSIMLNNTANPGTFLPRVSFLTGGRNPNFVTTGDLNGDTRPDVIAVDSFPSGPLNGLSVLLNDSDITPPHTFRLLPAARYGTAAGPGWVSVEDLDLDGHLDVVVAHADSGADGEIALKFNRGDGTFANNTNYEVVGVSVGDGNYPTSVKLGDFDGDGRLDAAVGAAPRFANGFVAVMRNLGDAVATLAPQINHAVGRHPHSLLVADLDCRVGPDLVTANYSDNSVSILLNDGSGDFGPAATYAVGTAPKSIAAGDLDGDSDPDLIVANSSGSLSVLMNNGDGTFAGEVGYPTPGLPLWCVGTGDFDDDGFLDVVAAKFGEQTSIQAVVVFRNDGLGGVLLPPQQIQIPFRPWSVAAGDMDDDGALDVVAMGPHGVAVLRNNGAGLFSVHRVYDTPPFTETVAALGMTSDRLVLHDLNGDGLQDILFTDGSHDCVFLMLNEGGGNLSRYQMYQTYIDSSSPALGDLDGDGALDVVASNRSGYLSVLLNQHGSAGLVGPTPGGRSSWEDCNGNDILDDCEIRDGTASDCNGNGIPDECDSADGTSQDANGNGIPDECEGVDLTVRNVDASLVIGDWQTLEIAGFVSAEAGNPGSVPAQGPFRVSFFEDTNQNGAFEADADTLLGSVLWPGLAAGGTVTVIAPVAGTVLFRDDLIYAFVDSDDVYAETDETNNYAQSGSLCVVSSQLAPDLTASFVRVVMGDDVRVTARVGNGGAVGVPAGVPVTFYDSDPRTGGALLGSTVLTTQALAPGEFEDVTLNLPVDASTDDFVWVAADRSELQNDCDDDNNVHNSGILLGEHNQVPVANPGGPYTTIECQPIRLDGTGSTDPDNDPLTYMWDLDGDGEFDDSTEPAPLYAFTADGVITIGLQVSDGRAESIPEFAQITVHDSAPMLSIIGPQTLGVDEDGQFEARITSPCDAIDRVEWDWDFDGVQHRPSGDEGAQQTHRFTGQGTFTVAARATDVDGSAALWVHTVVVVAEGGPHVPARGRIRVVIGVRDHDATNQVHRAQFTLISAHDDPITGPISLAFDNIQPSSVSLLDPAGSALHPDDPSRMIPYVDFTEFLPANVLEPGAAAGPKQIRFRAPDNEAFTFEAHGYLFNTPPRIISSPVTTATEGQRYRYKVEAVDDDGDPVFFGLLLRPEGMTIEPGGGLIDWMPDQRAAGDHPITVVATDGLVGGDGFQSFSIVVSSVNVAPVFTSTPPTIATIDTVYEYQVEAFDPDGDPLTYEKQVAPADMSVDPETGLVQWTPAEAGIVAVRLKVSDNAAHYAIQEYNLVVVSCPDPPLTTPIPSPQPATEGQPFNYQVEASHAGGTLVYSLPVGPPGMEISGAGLITWTPSFTSAGLRTVKVAVATNSTNCRAEEIFQVDVANANGPPQIDSVAVTTATEGTVYRYNVHATDPDNDAVTFVLAQGPEGMSIHEHVGALTWIVPQTAAAASPYMITVGAVDPSGEVGQQTFQLEIGAVNVVPQIVSVPVYTAIEGKRYTYQVVAVDADDPQGNFTYELDIRPEGMTVGQGGLIEWTPSQTAARGNPHAVQVTARDADGLPASQSYQIFVQAVNLPPVITNPCDQLTDTIEGQVYTYDLSTADEDADAPITFEFVEPQPVGMTIEATGPATGMIRWQVPQTAALGGPHVVQVRASDGAGTSAPCAVTVNVAEVNVAPVITSPPVTLGSVFMGYLYDVEATDADLDQLTYSLDPQTAPPGVGIDPETGAIEWFPGEDQTGIYPNIRVRVDDGHGEIAEQSFDVEILLGGQNTPPTIEDEPGPPTLATPGVGYVYQVVATDPDNNIRSHRLDRHPAGMTIDNAGLVTWTPFTADIGTHHVTVRVEDNGGAWAMLSYDLQVDFFPDNRQPQITSSPAETAQVDAIYEYQVQAQDPDNDALNYALMGPAGATIGVTTGLVRWLPTVAEIGIHSMTIYAFDGRGGSAAQTYDLTVSVSGTDIGPRIVSSPLLGAVADVPYSYPVMAEDPDCPLGDCLTYALIAGAPAGMGIDENGLITWIPTAAQVGSHGVTVTVTDDEMAQTRQPFVVTVFADLSDDLYAPEVLVTADPEVVDPGEPVTITVQATDDLAVATITLTVDGENVALDPQRRAVYTPTDPGGYVAHAVATDLTDKTGAATAAFYVRTTADNIRPVVAISSPGSDSELSSPAEIIGTATDDNLFRYTLALRHVDDGPFVDFHTGYTPVKPGGVLGTFDPTLLLNGIYDIRLRAEDTSGNIADAFTTLIVTGNMKVGSFIVSFNDLTIPMSGIPITIIRTYDSRDKTMGDFGVGWRLELSSLTIEENKTPGDDWEQVVFPGFFPTYVLRPVRPPVVSVTMPDGRADRFLLRPVPDVQLLYPIEFLDNVVYQPIPPTTSQLAILSGVPDLYEGSIPGTGRLRLLNETRSFDPAVYKLTRLDGTEFTFAGPPFGRRAKLQQVKDTNGNRLEFTHNGIIHSAGPSVLFERDGQGRITAIVDPEGQRVEYEYDSRGNLAAVRDREAVIADGPPTRFDYNHTHGLVEITDPRGVMAVRNLYDDEGRLIAVIEADGNRLDIDHAENAEVITDRLGNITIHEYDQRGNITATVSVALNERTERTYDDRDNELTVTDPLGRISTNTYDANDNLLSTTDFDGDTTTFTYNARGEVLTTTDPLGNVTANVYDTRGNLTGTTDAEGNVTGHTYDSAGRRLSTTDPLGNVTLFAYDGRGNLIQETDAFENVTTFIYDNQGNQRTRTRTRTLPDGSIETITEETEYDAEGRAVRQVRPLIPDTVMEYNEIGRLARVTNPRGIPTEFEYDDRGNQVATHHLGDEATPDDDSSETSLFDAEGRQIARTDRDGNTTRFEYDAAGRLIKTNMPDDTPGHDSDNPYTQTTYDAAGRVIARRDERGNVTQFVYDPDEPHQQITVPPAPFDANQTTQEFDANGNLVRITDANNHVTEFFYDRDNRLVETRFHDATRSTTTFDAAGRRIAEIDPANLMTQFGYDALGRLTSVTDEFGLATSYAYDEVGNLLTITDAEGRVTRMDYDALGRMTRRALPLNELEPSRYFETFEYDANGNRTLHTDLNGQVTRFVYDAHDRLIEKNFGDCEGCPAVTFEYTPAGLRTRVDYGGFEDTFAYDARGRLARVDYGRTGDWIEYTYNECGCGAGRGITSITTPYHTMSYTYDALNRLETVISADGVTTYTYDAVGNRASLTYPNGTRARYQYDALNRLTFLINERVADGSVISSYRYTLGPAGNRSRVVEDTGRTVDYEYDKLYRLTGEIVTNDPAGLNFSAYYVYDRFGNRLSKTVNAPGQQTATLYTYDDNDRLLSETQTVQLAAALDLDPRHFAALHGGPPPSRAAGWVLAGVYTASLAALLVPLGLLSPRRRAIGRSARRRRAYLRTVALLLLPWMIVTPQAVYGLHAEALHYVALAALGQPAPTTTATFYDYDDNGNLTRKRIDDTGDGQNNPVLAAEYFWDFENRLVAADVRIGPETGFVEYTYDADGIRTSKTVDGVTTDYLVAVDKNRPWTQLLVEHTGEEVVTYVHGDDLLSMTRPITGTSYYHTDGQMSTRRVSNAAGDPTDTYVYAAFGEMLASAGTTINTHKYTAQEYDSLLSLYYLRARYYFESPGRFISRDPLEGRILEPLTLHGYLYAGMNPVNFWDPTGKFSLLSMIYTGAIIQVLSSITSAAFGLLKEQPSTPSELLQLMQISTTPPSSPGPDSRFTQLNNDQVMNAINAYLAEGLRLAMWSRQGVSRTKILRAAWQKALDDRSRVAPEGQGYTNLVAAEHYLWSRSTVAESLTPTFAWDAIIFGYDLVKIVAHPLIPQTGNQPVSDPSAFVFQWAIWGSHHGQWDFWQ